MKFILVRHGQTTANESHIILGGEEGGQLSERGHRQVMELAKRLSREEFAEIYCSSDERARQTCEAVIAGRGCEPVYCDELQEIDMGELANKTHEEVEIQHPNIFPEIFSDPSKKIPGGESLLDVKARTTPLIHKLAQKQGNPTILAVGHNILNRVILATLLDIPLQKAKNIKQKNACISLLDVKPGFAQLYTLDNSIHNIR